MRIEEMAKRKQLTPETSERHNFRLNVAVLNHAASLKRVTDHLRKNNLKLAVRELDGAVKLLERVCFKNAAELGYKRPRKR
jgi:hypothetical protein